jgi:hypothetical protein
MANQPHHLVWLVTLARHRAVTLRPKIDAAGDIHNGLGGAPVELIQ